MSSSCIMRPGRLTYVDAVKGGAILLVVMGHVLAWMFDDFHEITRNAPSPSYLFKFIYSFHMPLFMFASGFLFGIKPVNDIGQYWKKINKSFLGLIVPYFVAGLLLYFTKGANLNRIFRYWYLLVLFELIVVSGGIQLLSARLSSVRCRLALEVIFTYLAYCGAGYLMRHHLTHWVEMWSFHKYLPFFFIGAVAKRIDFFEDTHVSPPVLAGLMVAFILAFCGGMGALVPWLSIAFFFYFFKLLPKGSLLLNVFSAWGKITLQIYVVHMFFLPKIPALGEWFQTMVRGGTVGILECAVVQFFMSLIMSILIIVLCWLVASLFSYSSLLSQLLFGRRLDAKIWEKRGWICE